MPLRSNKGKKNHSKGKKKSEEAPRFHKRRRRKQPSGSDAEDEAPSSGSSISGGSLHGSDSEPGLGSWTTNDQINAFAQPDYEPNQEYEVDAVLRWRRHPRKGYLQYRTAWSNFPVYSTTWEPEHMFDDRRIIKRFWKRIGGRPDDVPPPPGSDEEAPILVSGEETEALKMRKGEIGRMARRKLRKEYRQDKLQLRRYWQSAAQKGQGQEEAESSSCSDSSASSSRQRKRRTRLAVALTDDEDDIAPPLKRQPISQPKKLPSQDRPRADSDKEESEDDQLVDRSLPVVNSAADMSKGASGHNDSQPSRISPPRKRPPPSSSSSSDSDSDTTTTTSGSSSSNDSNIPLSAAIHRQTLSRPAVPSIADASTSTSSIAIPTGPRGMQNRPPQKEARVNSTDRRRDRPLAKASVRSLEKLVDKGPGGRSIPPNDANTRKYASVSAASGANVNSAAGAGSNAANSTANVNEQLLGGSTVKTPTGPAVKTPTGPAVMIPTGPAVKTPTGPAVKISTGSGTEIPTGPAVRTPLGTAVKSSMVAPDPFQVSKPNGAPASAPTSIPNNVAPTGPAQQHIGPATGVEGSAPDPTKAAPTRNGTVPTSSDTKLDRIAGGSAATNTKGDGPNGPDSQTLPDRQHVKEASGNLLDSTVSPIPSRPSLSTSSSVKPTTASPSTAAVIGPSDSDSLPTDSSSSLQPPPAVSTAPPTSVAGTSKTDTPSTDTAQGVQKAGFYLGAHKRRNKVDILEEVPPPLSLANATRGGISVKGRGAGATPAQTPSSGRQVTKDGREAEGKSAQSAERPRAAATSTSGSLHGSTRRDLQPTSKKGRRPERTLSSSLPLASRFDGAAHIKGIPSWVKQPETASSSASRNDTLPPLYFNAGDESPGGSKVPPWSAHTPLRPHQYSRWDSYRPEHRVGEPRQDDPPRERDMYENPRQGESVRREGYEYDSSDRGSLLHRISPPGWKRERDWNMDRDVGADLDRRRGLEPSHSPPVQPPPPPPPPTAAKVPPQVRDPRRAKYGPSAGIATGAGTGSGAGNGIGIIGCASPSAAATGGLGVDFGGRGSKSPLDIPPSSVSNGRINSAGGGGGGGRLVSPLPSHEPPRWMKAAAEAKGLALAPPQSSSSSSFSRSPTGGHGER